MSIVGELVPIQMVHDKNEQGLAAREIELGNVMWIMPRPKNGP
jgi:hypothetical protein